MFEQSYSYSRFHSFRIQQRAFIEDAPKIGMSGTQFYKSNKQIMNFNYEQRPWKKPIMGISFYYSMLSMFCKVFFQVNFLISILAGIYDISFCMLEQSMLLGEKMYFTPIMKYYMLISLFLFILLCCMVQPQQHFNINYNHPNY